MAEYRVAKYSKSYKGSANWQSVQQVKKKGVQRKKRKKRLLVWKVKQWMWMCKDAVQRAAYLVEVQKHKHYPH